MKQAKSIIGVAFVLIAMYVVWKVMPAYYANFEYQDYVETQARVESYGNHSEEEIAEI